jgi:hypothetical protein
MFTICLGKNGGFFDVGGFNSDKHLQDVMWFDMLQHGSSYKFKISGVAVNDHFIDGSEAWNYGFVDSGTTFSYLPPKMWD